MDDPAQSLFPQRVPASRKKIGSGVDMTPMVDATFLLLIFFVVTASFQIQKSIRVPKTPSNLPSRSPESLPELAELELRIDESGAFRVLSSQWQSETPSKQALITQLKQWRNGHSGDASLLVAVDQRAKLQSLVDAIDAGTLAGFQSLCVQSFDEFP